MITRLAHSIGSTFFLRTSSQPTWTMLAAMATAVATKISQTWMATKKSATGKRSYRNFIQGRHSTRLWLRPYSPGGRMALVKLIEYRDAPPAVKSVYDDIMKTRGVDWINNFWKALANDPRELARVWANVKQVMAPGALDPLVKEMIYVAVSATNGCEYCTHSHTAAARKKGMTDAMLMELLAVVGLANETNRLANGLRLDVDARFK